MENKKLNINAIKTKMEEFGVNQSELAGQLDVSRECVSQWLKGENFPKPRMLLELAKKLNLKFEQIVIRDQSQDPVIAFRKKAGVRTTDADYERARDMGEILKHLVTYLPYSKISRPASLANPESDYYYVQEAAREVRSTLKLKNDIINFTDLIKHFIDLHATIIPVMWGPKNRHENALHIYLPDSMTTWIYLNLDTNIIDFKFWMAHELGHVKTPNLEGDESEDFTDRFAGALLYPMEMAKSAYHDLIKMKNKGAVINRIKDIASDYIISPITVLKEINKYAEVMNLSPVDVDIFAAARNFCKEFPSVTEDLFNRELPDASLYIKTTGKVFDTCFFKILKKYLKDEGKSSGFVQRVLDLPLTDAEDIYRYLISASK